MAISFERTRPQKALDLNGPDGETVRVSFVTESRSGGTKDESWGINPD